MKCFLVFYAGRFALDLAVFSDSESEKLESSAQGAKHYEADLIGKGAVASHQEDNSYAEPGDLPQFPNSAESFHPGDGPKALATVS